MAVHPDLQALVQVAIGTDPVVLLDVVHGELTHRARSLAGPRVLAKKALAELAWLGSPLATDLYVRATAIQAIQLEVANGRALQDEYEHWADSVPIAMAAQAAARTPGLQIVFLTEDNSARVRANSRRSCRPPSDNVS